MLSDELVQLATTRIEIEFIERQEQFSQEIQLAKSELTLQGLESSGAMQERIVQAITREFDIRAMLAWQVLSRVLSGQPFFSNSQLSYQLKEQIAKHLRAGCEDLAVEYQWAISLFTETGAFRSFDDIREKAVAKISSEIDISLLAARQQQTTSGASTTVNIYQPYGVVQTGSGSIAHFTQQFDQVARQKLAHALDAIEQSIANAHEVSSAERSQIQEVVREIHAEVLQSSPNVPRLRRLLVGVATTIQTLGNASSAYALLKAAAALIGIHLP
jgi:hypothetical protein